MTPPQGMRNKLDDQDYPASTPLTPGRSAGRQRRYSRADLALAIRVRELLDQNMPLTAATASSASNANSPQPTSASPTSNTPATRPPASASRPKNRR